MITYHCTVEEDINGDVVINTAKADADNAEAVTDSEKIWVNSPVLDQTKKADREEYMVGDTITYQVDLDQTQTGCVARDITFTDTIDTEGVKLQKNSIVLIDQDGNKVDPANVTVNGNTFTVETGLNLVKAHGYMNIDLGAANEETGDSGRTEVGDYHPLKLERETHLTLEYAVEVTDPDLAGERVHNVITANSKENIPVDSEAEVPIYGPALDA